MKNLQSAPKLFSLNAEYLIPDEASAMSLFDDASCFSEVSFAIVDHLASEFGDLCADERLRPQTVAGMLNAASFLMQMSQALSLEAHVRISKAGSTK